jgi:hypothetical protein
MASAQQQAVFSPEEAQRFAALMAGFEIGNASEVEAIGKGRQMRRMAGEKGIRLVDAFELAEIRDAIDAQMQPVRLAVPDVAALETEIEDLRGKLAVAVPKVRELAEDLESLTREIDEAALSDARFWAWMFGIEAIAGLGILICGIVMHDWLMCAAGCVACAGGSWCLISAD